MPRLQRLDLRFYVNGWEQQGGTCLPVGIENLPSSGLKIHLYLSHRLNARDVSAEVVERFSARDVGIDPPPPRVHVEPELIPSLMWQGLSANRVGIEVAD
uniref:Uncharacterized protein n=1 Tax=Oryza nivara TaxID=4536 RepID=A0A0E0ICA6_ORYNI